MKDIPLVSTVIPTYKRAEMLSRAIDSVLNQTYKSIEVIVVDDNNPHTDYRKMTETKMKKYSKDSRVKYIKHNNNRNGSAARNTGIKNARGKYICFLDDDNYFFSDKIEKQVEYLVKHPEYSAAYCGLQYDKKQILPFREGDLTYEQLLGNNIIDTNMIIIEKSVAEEIGGWDERLKRNQDVAFMLRYFQAGYKIGLVKETLAFIDLKDRNNVANPKENEKNFERLFEYYDTQIEFCERNIKNARKNIYSFRYRAVFLNYLKHKDYKGALRLYLKMIRISPFIFNKYLLSGISKKVQGKPLFRIDK